MRTARDFKSRCVPLRATFHIAGYVAITNYVSTTCYGTATLPLSYTLSFEGSEESNLTTRGFYQIIVNHRPSILSCRTLTDLRALVGQRAAQGGLEPLCSCASGRNRTYLKLVCKTSASPFGHECKHILNMLVTIAELGPTSHGIEPCFASL